MEQHPSTSSVEDETSAAKYHAKSRFRKWRSFGRDNNRDTKGSIPCRADNVRDPVNAGKFEGWIMVGRFLKSPSLVGT